MTYKSVNTFGNMRHPHSKPLFLKCINPLCQPVRLEQTKNWRAQKHSLCFGEQPNKLSLKGGRLVADGRPHLSSNNGWVRGTCLGRLLQQPLVNGCGSIQDIIAGDIIVPKLGEISPGRHLEFV